jgi:hypothetical protein
VSASAISHIPISESRLVSRERTFRLMQARPDFKDVIGQIVILVSQLHDEKFTGEVQINFTQGSVNNAKLVESKKIVDIGG